MADCARLLARPDAVLPGVQHGAGRPDPAICQCGHGKGRMARYCRRCTERWDRAGRPDAGPPPPMPNTESRRRASEARRIRREAWASEPVRDPDAEYEAHWRLVAEPQRRIDRVPVAAGLVLCVGARAAEGVRRLLWRHHGNREALVIVLAAAASRVIARAIVKHAPEPAVRCAAITVLDLNFEVTAMNRFGVGRLLRRHPRRMPCRHLKEGPAPCRLTL